jgi:hypothetical protein
MYRAVRHVSMSITVKKDTFYYLGGYINSMDSNIQTVADLAAHGAVTEKRTFIWLNIPNYCPLAYLETSFIGELYMSYMYIHMSYKVRTSFDSFNVIPDLISYRC